MPDPVLFQSLKEFRRGIGLSLQGIVRELFRAQPERFQVRNENVAVRNLSAILEATLTLANRKGFQAMSLRDLAKATGMSLGGLYAYIRSKDDLVSLIQAHGRLLVHRLLIEADSDSADARAQLAAAVRRHLYLSEVLRAWFYFSYMEARHLPAPERHAAQDSEITTEEWFRKIIESGQQRGVFREGDAQLIAALLKAWLQEWYLKRWKYAARGVNVEQYAAGVIEMLERLLDSPGA